MFTRNVPPSQEKRKRYQLLIPQVEQLISHESDLIANLANISAALAQSMNFFWTGFYFVKGEQLVLGPFQGPVACTRIAYGQGVCGKAWKEKKCIVVPDVDKFPGHIACSEFSKSEIVLPVFKNDKVHLILDIDSELPNNFDETDEECLQQVVVLIEKLLK